MTPRFQTAYDLARARFRAVDRRVTHVALAKPVPVREAVALRPAAEVPYTPRPISIMAPKADTPSVIHAFVLNEFREAQRKREKRAG